MTIKKRGKNSSKAVNPNNATPSTKKAPVRHTKNRTAAQSSRQKKKSKDKILEAEVENGRMKGKVLKLRVELVLRHILQEAQNAVNAPPHLDLYNMGPYLYENYPDLYQLASHVSTAALKCPNLFPS